MLNHLLACPRCDTPLESVGEKWRCKGCKTQFPGLAGVPFLFAEPGVALDEWRARYHARLQEIAHRIQQCEQVEAREDLLPETTARLSHQREAQVAHIEELKALLEPLDVTRLTADHSTYLALRTRLPADQGLLTYYANLHRDWCWGNDENTQSVKLVHDALNGHDLDKLLVLGSGGGRLAYDLHQSGSHELTVAVDFNPLLVLAAEQLAHGRTLELHEFPIAPRTTADTAVPRTLKAPAVVRDGFCSVLANVLRAPFRPGSFNTLVTPWLVDVVDEPLSVQAARWNRLLAKGGKWVWFGSHAFRGASLAEQLSLEESQAVIQAQGFSAPEVTEADIPYMVSPANRHARTERVVVMSMTKLKNVPVPPRHVALPDWLVQSDLPVPARQSFQTQSMHTRIHAFILAMIDGKRSLDDMAALMEEQRLMPKAEAVDSLRNFLIRALESDEGYQTL